VLGSTGQRQSCSEWISSIGVRIRSAWVSGLCAATRSGSVPLYWLTNSQPMSLEPSKLSKALAARSLIAARNRSLWATSQEVM
jgi:hypothetical protein